MTYLTSKKIYPGNWVEALNGWYKNFDSTGAGGTADVSKAGPTSVLAIPGYRYFQQRGYVPVTWVSGDSATYGQTMSVIIPSPYRQDDTRTDITGMVISGNSTQAGYVYRAAISVGSGWGDNRVASGVYNTTGNVIAFGRDSSGPVAASGESVAAAVLSSTVSGEGAGTVYFAGGSQAFGSVPVFIGPASGLQVTAGSGFVNSGAVYKQITSSTTFKVYSKASGDATAVAGGVYISQADKNAGLTGYLFVEVCYLVPDNAPDYSDLEAYLNNRTVSST